ncbi:5-oxoprolinase subunit A [Ureibacillus acetophenoni]
MARVDLNCDIGESFGRYTLANQEEILEHVTSANIACGFHAGDPSVMRETVKLAIKHNVKIRAHPGLGTGRVWTSRNGDFTSRSLRYGCLSNRCTAGISFDRRGEECNM